MLHLKIDSHLSRQSRAQPNKFDKSSSHLFHLSLTLQISQPSSSFSLNPSIPPSPFVLPIVTLLSSCSISALPQPLPYWSTIDNLSVECLEQGMDCPVLSGVLTLSVVALIALSIFLKVTVDVARSRTCSLHALCVQLSVQTTALLAARDEKRSTLRTVNQRSRELAALRRTLNSTEEALEHLRREKDSATTDAFDAHARADTLAAKLAAALDQCDMLDNRLSQAHHAHLELLSKLHADASLRTAAVLSLTQPQVSVPVDTNVSEPTDLCEGTVQPHRITPPASSSSPTGTTTKSVVPTATSSPSPSFTMPVPNASIDARSSSLETQQEMEISNRASVLSEEVRPEFAEMDEGASNVEQGGLLTLRPDLSVTPSSSSLSSGDKTEMITVEDGNDVHLETHDGTPQVEEVLSDDGTVHRTPNRRMQRRDEHVLELHRAPWADATQPDLHLGGANGLHILTMDEGSFLRTSNHRIAFSTEPHYRTGSRHLSAGK